MGSRILKPKENLVTTSTFAEVRKKLYEEILERSKTALSFSLLPISDFKSSDIDLNETNMVQSVISQTGTAKTHI